MTSQPGSKTFAIHISINISRSKVNQTMIFGQLLEYNMKNIFLGKSYTKSGGETIPRPFFNKSKLGISLDQLSTVLYSFFLLYDKMRSIKIPDIKSFRDLSSVTIFLVQRFIIKQKVV